MADELDKAVDMMRQLLADDGAKEKLSGIIDSFTSGSESDKMAVTDSISSSLLPSLLQQKNEESESPELNLSSLLSSGILQNLFSGTNDRRVTLLRALKPCLSEKRSNRVEHAITLMQIVGMSSLFGLEKLFK